MSKLVIIVICHRPFAETIEENKMIKELPESEGSVLGVEITGKESLAEEKAWIEKI